MQAKYIVRWGNVFFNQLNPTWKMLPIKENLTDLEKKESVYDDFLCIGFDLPTADAAFAHFRVSLQTIITNI